MTITQKSSVPSQAANRPKPVQHHQIVIVGGGTAGITVAARLTKGLFRKLDVAIIEPSDKHYYQPAWTLVGGGASRKEDAVRDEATVIPHRATWIPDAVTKFDPEHHQLQTAGGCVIEYDFLVVAAGIQINWEEIPGLKQSIGQGGVCSNGSFETVQSTWEAIRSFKGGTAIFTSPKGGECSGAPQEACYLAEDYFHRSGQRQDCRVIYASAGEKIFAVPEYRHALERVVSRKGIETMFRHHLVEIKPETNEAVFENIDTQQQTSLHYDLLHVMPPMSAPGFIARSPLAGVDGWVEVDKFTLQHARFPNVFALGDCSNLPTSKTAGAVRKQAPVLAKNLMSKMANHPLKAKYNGYTSCPLVTGYGSLILAEFGYDMHPAETFWFDQTRERRMMWWLKKYGLPFLYWHGMLKGRI